MPIFLCIIIVKKNFNTIIIYKYVNSTYEKPNKNKEKQLTKLILIKKVLQVKKWFK